MHETFQYAIDDDKADYELVLTKFRTYSEPRKNIVFERYQFWGRNQNEGEPVDQCVTDLCTKAAKCEFQAHESDMIRDKIVFGVHDTRIKERLLREADLMLARALDDAEQQKRASIKLMQWELMKQHKEIKLTTTFNSVPHTVINETGNSLIVGAPSGAQYSRNTSFVKRFIEPTELATEAEPETVVDNLFGDTTDYDWTTGPGNYTTSITTVCGDA